MRRLAILLAILLVGSGPPIGTSLAGTIRVPDDEPTLERALALAIPGDVVLAGPGEYEGPFLLPPGVRVEAPAGPLQTILRGVDSLAVVTVDGGGPGTALVGFTVREGLMGVDLRDCEVEILDCRVLLNANQGIRCGSGTGVWIRGCEIAGNGLGVVATSGSRVYLGGNRVRRNREGIYVAGGDVRVIRNLLVENRYGITVLEAEALEVGGSLRAGNDFRGNTNAGIRNLGEQSIDATFNFWGSTDCVLVRREIEGKVTFLPMIDEARETVVEACP